MPEQSILERRMRVLRLKHQQQGETGHGC